MAFVKVFWLKLNLVVLVEAADVGRQVVVVQDARQRVVGAAVRPLQDLLLLQLALLNNLIAYLVEQLLKRI